MWQRVCYSVDRPLEESRDFLRGAGGTWVLVVPGCWALAPGKMPILRMSCPVAHAVTDSGSFQWEGTYISLPLILCPLYSEAKEQSVGTPGFKSVFLWATPRISRNAKVPLTNDFAFVLLSLLKPSDRLFHPDNLYKILHFLFSLPPRPPLFFP